MAYDSAFFLSGGLSGLLNLFFYLIGIVIAWFALGAVKWDLFLNRPRGGRASTLRLLLAIVIGFQLAQFVLAYMNSSILLKNFFR